jgi:hypothetical protein
VLADQAKELDADLQKEIHQLEIFYEQLYDEIYYLREDIITGKSEPKEMLINQFDELSRRYKGDNQYDKLQIMKFDVSDTLGLPDNKGVDNFWLRAMLNHPNISLFITEWDRPILSCLTNIKIILHKENGYGFDIEFTF